MKIARFSATPILLTAVVAAIASADDGPQNADIGFNEQIRPVLSEYCFACHGPDSASRKADLRLDDRVSAISAGAIAPGSIEESELIARINSDDPEVMMPPPTSGKKLKAEHKQLLAQWIQAGAPWEEHWAFIKPKKVNPPRSEGVDQWARNAVDFFVLEQLQKRSLRPNREEDRYTLARRAALDLTGMPPNWRLVQSFVANGRPNAFERYVDALLASPYAGEHRARFWLDAARYGDTHGMHVDNYREIWPYRDWVVRAFNSNMPFDKFVVQQIAGDLLPSASLQQRIATGFSRCNITTSEGGAIPAELDVRYMVDRVETTATVFLGLTAGCAVCHDHKYDPIRQREFYAMGAFFNNTTQPAMDGNQKDTPPVVVLPGAEHEAEWRTLQSRAKNIQTRLGQWKSNAEKWWAMDRSKMEHPIGADELLLWLPLTENGADSSESADASVTPKAKLPKSAKWVTNHPGGRRGVRFGEGASLFEVALPQLRSDEPISISCWIRTPDRVMTSVLFEQTAKTKDKKTVGWKITSNTQGALIFELFDAKGKSLRGVLPDNEALHPRSWQHICVRYSGGQANSSVSILLNGRPADLRNASEAYVEATALAEAPLKIAGRLQTAGLSDIRIFRRWLGDEEVHLLAREFSLRKLLASDTPWSDLDREHRIWLSRLYNQTSDKDYRALSCELSKTMRRRDFIYARSTTTLVMQEKPSAPRAWVLERGEYDQRREEVAPDVPAVLPPLPQGAPKNRLGLAKWLVHPDHPLTARVMVNRLWQSVFGVGLVKTSEDFGVMGDRPSHPQLLDWLAAEFVESGWNVKHILKLIVTSAAYRQSSKVTTEKLQQDPHNRFLSRGVRLRLDAEVLRDQALAVSGLLQRTIGGASVRPYQPAGLWKVVAITGSNTRQFRRDSGKALYRRSVYTFWKRTSPPPSMAVFNAPTREQCTVRRERTNTPLQALTLMNDIQFVEAARRVAEYVLSRHEDDLARAELMLRTVLVRPGEEADIKDMLSAAAGLRPMFEQNPEAAKKLIQTGDTAPDAKQDPVALAVWTMVANMLLNRDDFISK